PRRDGRDDRPPVGRYAAVETGDDETLRERSRREPVGVGIAGADGEREREAWVTKRLLSHGEALHRRNYSAALVLRQQPAAREVDDAFPGDRAGPVAAPTHERSTAVGHEVEAAQAPEEIDAELVAPGPRRHSPECLVRHRHD